MPSEMKIPIGWETTTLGDLVSFSSGGTPSKERADYWNGDIPWVSALEMHDQEIDKASLQITSEGLQAGSRLAQKNDLLLLVRGSMLWNKIPICICNRDVAFNQDVKALRVKKGIGSRYLLYWFLAKQNRLMDRVVGTGIGAGKLETNDLVAFPVLLPPLPEQKKIAEILGAWDEGIGKLEKFIAGKDRRKKALMQKLLTGKQRLKEFKGEWKQVRLGDVCKINPKAETLPNVFQYIDLECITNGKLMSCRVINQKEAPSRAQRLLQRGDVLFQLVRPYQMNNFIVALDSSLPVVASTGYAQLRCNKTNPLFLYQRLHENCFVQEVVSKCTGSNYPAITSSDLGDIPISIPVDIPEQKAIAEVLSTADEEIRLLSKKLDLMKHQKKGLMQKLLSGAWRVGGGSD